MADFLSAEWIRELDDAVRAVDVANHAVDGTFVVEQVVRGAPGGDVRYLLVVTSDGARVLSADGHGEADVSLCMDYDTACALHLGARNAQTVIAQDRMKLRGAPEALVRHSGVLAALDGAIADVRARTTLAAVGPGVG